MVEQALPYIHIRWKGYAECRLATTLTGQYSREHQLYREEMSMREGGRRGREEREGGREERRGEERGSEGAHPAVVVVVGGTDSAALQVRGELVVNVARLNGQGGKPKEGHSLV